MTPMTNDERTQYVSALQLLLAGRHDADMVAVIQLAFPQFRVVHQYQLENLRVSIQDAKNKIDAAYIQVP